MRVLDLADEAPLDDGVLPLHEPAGALVVVRQDDCHHGLRGFLNAGKDARELEDAIASGDCSPHPESRLCISVPCVLLRRSLAQSSPTASPAFSLQRRMVAIPGHLSNHSRRVTAFCC